jgi:hypothetical protein
MVKVSKKLRKKVSGLTNTSTRRNALKKPGENVHTIVLQINCKLGGT